MCYFYSCKVFNQDLPLPLNIILLFHPLDERNFVPDKNALICTFNIAARLFRELDKAHTPVYADLGLCFFFPLSNSPMF